MLGVREALEAQAKPADAREELGNLDLRHVSPIAAVSVFARSMITDLADKVKIGSEIASAGGSP